MLALPIRDGVHSGRGRGEGTLPGLSPGAGEGWEEGFRFGLRPPSAEGLAWRAPLSHRPTLRRFPEQGDTPCTPGGGCAPCTPLGGWGFRCGLRPPSAKGLAWRAPSFNEGAGLACALLQRRGWLGVRRCPTGPPSNVFRNRGTRCTPGGGCAPCTLLGDGGFVVACALLQWGDWLAVGGLAWPAPLSRPLRPPTFWGTGGGTPFLTCPRVQGQDQSRPRRGLRPCALLGERRGAHPDLAHCRGGRLLGRP